MWIGLNLLIIKGIATDNAILKKRCAQLEAAADEHKTLEKKLFTQIQHMTKNYRKRASKPFFYM